jgi:ABC-type lipoprotein release transport system permease subunit
MQVMHSKKFNVLINNHTQQFTQRVLMLAVVEVMIVTMALVQVMVVCNELSYAIAPGCLPLFSTFYTNDVCAFLI